MLDLSYVVCGCEGVAVLLLGHTGAVDAGRAHLGEDLVQPLQRAIEMQFYPAGGAGHCLTSAGYREEEAARLVIARACRTTSEYHTIYRVVFHCKPQLTMTLFCV